MSGRDQMLDERVKELIAIGASITANCQPCLHYHVNKAFKYGATEQEIASAIEVGKAVRKGASFKMDQFVTDLHKAITSSEDAEEECNC